MAADHAGVTARGRAVLRRVHADGWPGPGRRWPSADVDVLLLSVGADLPYLTGYEAMPLERLTMLVLPRDGDATLVVPRLEAPRVVERPDVFSIRAVGRDRRPDRARRRPRWRRPRRRPSATRPGPSSWSTCIERLPGTAFAQRERRRSGPLRAVKDAAEIEALRRGGRGGRPGRRRSSRPARSRSSAAPRPRCRPTSAAGSWPRATTG